MDQTPVRLSPAFKDYLWGGTRLKTEFQKKSDLDKVAESWELSTHKDGQSTVASGAFQGKTLSEYIEANGKECLGSRAAAFESFPILIKLIDAADNLSIQVHPSDDYALKVEGEYGKTEMWYILDCTEGATLYYGVNTTLTKEELAERIQNNTLLSVLNKVPVKKGDVFFIRPGTIHAIGKGILLCEIQQNSNTTYRVYDFDRRDKDGNPRELHVEKAMEVAQLTPSVPYQNENPNILANCKYFTVEKLVADGSATLPLDKDCFRSVVAVSGEATLSLSGEEFPLRKGDSLFIPAQDGTAQIRGNAELIISYV